MQMSTEINIVPHAIRPSRKIDGRVYKVTNYRLHGMLLIIARSLFAKIKSTSNNMSAEIVPRDISGQRSSFAAFEAAYKFAITNNNPPTIAHELENEVVLPTYEEIQTVANIKSKMVALEEMRLAEVIMASDSAASGANIGDQSKADIDAQVSIYNNAMDLYYGKGGISPESNKDVGLQFPVFKHLGVAKPDFDRDFAVVAETSPDRPDKGRPDVADIQVSGD